MGILTMARVRRRQLFFPTMSVKDDGMAFHAR
jgi:hypothetical protein